MNMSGATVMVFEEYEMRKKFIARHSWAGFVCAWVIPSELVRLFVGRQAVVRRGILVRKDEVDIFDPENSRWKKLVQIRAVVGDDFTKGQDKYGNQQ